MSVIDTDFVYREDSWLCNIRISHELFCNCNSWTSHLKKLLDFQQPGWLGESQEDKLGEEETGEKPGDPTDAELIAALEEVEDGEEVEDHTRLEF
uniref:ORF2 n=1 Tax=Rodent Torque teno virus 1 TaxID=1514664 RepID=X2G9Y4_9VIRU|nr:ORF2 [Rodent Torque teno virus 1]